MGCGQTKHFRGTYTARVHGFTADKELVEKLLGLTVPELKSRALRSGVMKIDIKELRDDSKASQRALVDMILEREAGEEPMELKEGEEPMELKEGEEPMKRKKIDMTRSELRSTVRKKVKKFTRVIEKQMVIVRKKEDAERAEDEASSRLAYKREHDGAPKGPTGEERLLEIKKSYAFVGNSDFRKDTKATYEAIGGGQPLCFDQMEATLNARAFPLIKEVCRDIYRYGVDAWRAFGDEMDEASSRAVFNALDKNKDGMLDPKEFAETAKVLVMCTALERLVRLAEDVGVDCSGPFGCRD